MSNISLNEVLVRMGHPMGWPFPTGARTGDAEKIASGFSGGNVPGIEKQVDYLGTPIISVTDENLGRYEFMPVIINAGDGDILMPNALIMISGEKAIIETDVIDRGTVFEKVYERPYDISIIITLIGENGKWPAEQYKQTAELYRGKKVSEQNNAGVKNKDLVTLKCALTNPFLQPENNFLITKIAVLDNEGCENVEVVQIDGRSNIDFELIIN